MVRTEPLQSNDKRRNSGAPVAHKMAKPCVTGAESVASFLIALLEVSKINHSEQSTQRVTVGLIVNRPLAISFSHTEQ